MTPGPFALHLTNTFQITNATLSRGRKASHKGFVSLHWNEMPRREDSTLPLRRLKQVLVMLTTCTWLEGTTTSWHTCKYNHESSRWHHFTAPRAGVLEGQSNPELPRGHQSLWMLMVAWWGMVNLAAQKKQWSWLYACKHTIQTPRTASTAQKAKAGKTHYRGKGRRQWGHRENTWDSTEGQTYWKLIL